MSIRRLRVLFFAAVGLATLGACKPGANVTHTGYIVGPTSDIIQISRETGAKLPMDVFHASVLIVTRLPQNKVKYCSGTLIEAESSAENLRVITNHHCFAEMDGESRVRTALMVEACSATEIFFGFAPKLGSELTRVGCKAGSLRSDPTLDLALFTLDRAPPAVSKPLGLWPDDNVPAGRTALIVHYPDVKENLAPITGQIVSLPTAALTTDDCKVLGPFARNEWNLDASVPYSVRHSCDLVHGSSGSPLVDSATHQIIGLNWGGIKVTYDGVTRTDNVATRTAYMRTFIAGVPTPPPAEHLAANGSSDALGARAGAISDDGGESSGKKKKFFGKCGTLGEDTRMGSAMSTSLIFFGLFLIPLAFVFRPRQAARLAGLSLALFFVASSRGAAASFDGPTSWANTHLLNTLFTQEYESRIESAEPEPRATKADFPAMEDPETVGLWQRNVFALASSESRKQKIFGRTKFARLGRAHEAKIVKRKLLNAKLLNDYTGRVPSPAGRAERLLPLIHDTFADAQSKRNWAAFIDSYQTQSIACPIRVQEIKTFADGQRALLSSGQLGNPSAVLSLAQGANLAHIQCLSLALMASPEIDRGDQAFDPLPLLRALRQLGSQFAQDSALKVILSLRLVQVGDYPEALRVLLELQDSNPAYRLAYDSVQRIYSFKQKGKGEVALKGI